MDEVRQVALSYTRVNYPVLSGTPQVVLTRPVTNNDLPGLGLPPINHASIEEPPLMLAIVKGNFGQPIHRSGLASGQSSQGYRYIGYIFDLWAGSPMLTIASPVGGEFRIALNDPSLPVVPSLAVSPLSTAPKELHYGDIAPTTRPNPPQNVQTRPASSPRP